MKVSVVICTYSRDRFEDFVEAVESVREQTYGSVEIVIVIDGNDAVCADTRDLFADIETIRIHCNEENRGLSYSRSRGAELATGEVIAFLDDDAIAQPDWIEELVRGYEETDAIAVGGRMIPEWVAGKPDHLPEEFYWLIGANYDERMEPWTEVRNTLGSNMSFRARVFDELGGFDEDVGLTADSQIQADETEFAMRMQQAFGEGMLYQPDAVVAHKVFEYRTEKRWLCTRAFWQGYSKRVLARSTTVSIDEDETEFLGHLATVSVPKRLQDLTTGPTRAKLQQLGMVIILTLCVGLGYLYAAVPRVGSRDVEEPTSGDRSSGNDTILVPKQVGTHKLKQTMSGLRKNLRTLKTGVIDQRKANTRRLTELYREGGVSEVYRGVRDYYRYNVADKTYHSTRTDNEQRWDCIESHLNADHETLVDLGCADGFFLERAAARGMNVFGYEGNQSRVERATKRCAGYDGVTVEQKYISPSNIDELPASDVTLFLTVHHHWIRQYGWEAAAEMFRTCCRRTKLLCYEPPGNKIVRKDGSERELDPSESIDHYTAEIKEILGDEAIILESRIVDYKSGDRADPLFVLDVSSYE